MGCTLNSLNDAQALRKGQELALHRLEIGVHGTKNMFFEKQSGEVTDNKGLATKNKPEQTGKQSGEVVDNT